ncbi:PDZ and LIM domain protein 4-like [Lineus longissimus]|uniref:PDZ and LIM domain protein 4-like n=1 Tax=Lineus longissimus TaxID=88925 RepID=UPI002B4D6331
MSTINVTLKRKNSSEPWGFRMHGGVDYQKPLFMQKITKNSVAHKAGLEPGDVILKIGHAQVDRMTHQQAKMEIIRAGCDVDFVVLKHGIDMAREMASSKPAAAPEPDQDHHQKWEGTGAENKQLQSRSFRMLQLSVNDSEAGGDMPISAVGGNLEEKRQQQQAKYAEQMATQY